MVLLGLKESWRSSGAIKVSNGHLYYDKNVLVEPLPASGKTLCHMFGKKGFPGSKWAPACEVPPALPGLGHERHLWA